MEADRSRTRWTWAEYARLPSEGSTRHEVIAGELAVTPSPTLRHQRIVRNLVEVLGSLLSGSDLGELFPGPVDVLFARGDYLQPDLVFVREDRSGLLSERGIEGPPDLVVEILSPSTEDRDRGIKLERYRHHGVPEYWIVDPDARTVEVWQFTRGAGVGRGADRQGELHQAGSLFRWTPGPGAEPLAVDVAQVFRGVEGLPGRE